MFFSYICLLKISILLNNFSIKKIVFLIILNSFSIKKYFKKIHLITITAVKKNMTENAKKNIYHHIWVLFFTTQFLFIYSPTTIQYKERIKNAHKKYTNMIQTDTRNFI